MDFLQHITLETAGIGSKLVNEYFSGSPVIKKLYSFSPDIEGLKQAVSERKKYPSNRQLLYDVLHKQYGRSVLSESLKSNIEVLLQKNSYTVTTGHQLNLFTGPLYFIYKIASVISLSQKLNVEIPGHHFVPIYWMNSEDHDFAEINHFFLRGEKFEWEVAADKYGPVGRMALEGIEPFMNEIKSKFDDLSKTDPVFDYLIHAYKDSETLSVAHREITNKIFGEYGLVILDQDDADLKSAFSEYLSDEIINGSSIESVETTNKYLEANDFKPQVLARAINMFYIGKGYRERIIKKEEAYALADNTVQWTKTEMMTELKKNPENFSPNVVIRPLYQEFILPNVAYIGGPAEIAYWLQYKTNFDVRKVFFPALILRDCFLILPEKKLKKVTDMGLRVEDFFRNLDEIINNYIREHHGHEMNVDPFITDLNKQYDELLQQVKLIDASMDGMVNAARQKALNDLNKIGEKMKKGLKAKNEAQLNSIRNLYSSIFPQGEFQERHNNLFDQTTSTSDFVQDIIRHSDPLDTRLKVLKG